MRAREDGARELSRAAASGVVWTALERVGGRVLNFVVLAVLARLLAPDDFGLLALAMVVLAFAEVVAGQGLAEAIIQAPEDGGERLSTAFWINLAGGLVLCLIAVAGAGLFAGLFREPRMTGVLRVLSVTFVVAATSGVHQALLRKRMAFRELALQSFLAAAAGGAVGVAMAVTGFGVWSLVGQSLATAVTGAAALWWLEPWRPQRRFSGARARELVRFGASVVGSRLANFVNRRGDDLVVGAVLGSAALGLYTVAYRVVLALSSALLGTSNAVAYPTLVKIRDDRDRLEGVYAFAVFATCLAAFPLFVGTSICAREITMVAFGPTWLAAVPVLRVLALIGVVHGLTYNLDVALLAVDKPHVAMVLKAVNAAANLTAFLVAVRWGIVAVAAAFVLRGVVMAPVQMLVLQRWAGIRAVTCLRAAAGPAAACAVMTGVVLLVWHRLTAATGAAPRLAIMVASGALAYAATVAVVAPHATRRALGSLPWMQTS